MLIPRNPSETKDYELLATTLRSIGDAVLTSDLKARITFMNPMAELLTGWAAEDAEGKKVVDVLRLVDEDSGEDVVCPVLRVLESDQSTGYSNHTVIRSLDGTSRIVAYNAAPIRDGDGRTTGVVVVFHHTLAKSELHRAEERFQLIARATNDAVWDLDFQSGRLWCNDVITTLFGYTAEDVGDSFRWWLSKVHPEDRRRVTSGYRSARRSHSYFQQEYRFRNRDGTYSAVMERGYVLRNAEGRAIRMLAAVMDVTGRREAQEELVRMNLELEREVESRTLELRQANRELESFSYSVSHDLRAPLRNILASSKMLEGDADLMNEEHRATLARLVASANRMSDLIDDLLEYSRLARSSVRLEPVDVTELARSVASEVRMRLSPRVLVEVEPHMVAQADRGLLTILFENLIENACKFSANVDEPRVEVGTFHRRDEHVYFVRDNGVGFDPDDAHRLFEPFERLHSVEEFPGTGIGLANVQRIVKRHGGRIWAEGKPNQGATFYFTLG